MEALGIRGQHKCEGTPSSLASSSDGTQRMVLAVEPLLSHWLLSWLGQAFKRPSLPLEPRAGGAGEAK